MKAIRWLLLYTLFHHVSAGESRENHGIRGSADISEQGATEDSGVDTNTVDASFFRIVNGTQASDGDYPYFVRGNGCGGSLIAPRVVMTAAHCSAYRFPTVRIGLTNRTDPEDGETINVMKQIVHPSYSGQRHDFRLLILEKASKYAPVKLNTDIAVPVVNAVQTVIGMGAISETGPSSRLLLEVDVNHISNSECSSQYGGNFNGDVMLCAMIPGGGKDACQGDSGGPIMDKASGKQVGVVSWGSGCARPDAAGVYARISAVYPWIRDHICSNTPDDCPPEVDEEEGTQTEVRVRVVHDNYPEEVAWSLRDATGTVYMEQKQGDVQTKFMDVSKTKTVPKGDYTLTVVDGYGDGLREAGNGDVGRIEIFVDGKFMKRQDAYYTSQAEIDFSISTDAAPNDTVKYEVQVQYDSYPGEFAWNLTNIDTGVSVASRGLNSPSLVYSLYKTEINLTPGQTYKVELQDGWGDGLQWKNGYFKVIAQSAAGKETLVEDRTEFTEKTLTFGVPDDIARQIKGERAASHCSDTDHLFEVSDTIGERSCVWLNENYSKFNYLCEFLSVASVCASTCNACSVFAGTANP